MAEKLTWSTEKRRVSSLVAWDKNPRKLSDAQKAQLEESIRRFDLVEVPAINTDGKIVAGHQRIGVMVALGRGEEEIDVRVPSRKLTDAEFREYNLRSNKNVGDWDWSLLGEMDRALLLRVGFEQGEILAELGLSDAGDEDVDDERLEALSVYPPEASKLRELAAIHFATKEEYDRVKAAVEAGTITAAKILALL